MGQEETAMDGHRIANKPAWWLLYVTVLMMGALLVLVEGAVVDTTIRTVLETVIALATFGLMLLWLRLNRVAMELEHYPRDARITTTSSGLVAARAGCDREAAA
jgi:hypothetical protein